MIYATRQHWLDEDKRIKPGATPMRHLNGEPLYSEAQVWDYYDDDEPLSGDTGNAQTAADQPRAVAVPSKVIPPSGKAVKELPQVGPPAPPPPSQGWTMPDPL